MIAAVPPTGPLYFSGDCTNALAPLSALLKAGVQPGKNTLEGFLQVPL